MSATSLRLLEALRARPAATIAGAICCALLRRELGRARRPSSGVYGTPSVTCAATPRSTAPQVDAVAARATGTAGMIDCGVVERGSSMWRTCQRFGYLPPIALQVRPDAARAPLERVVVDELAGLAVLAVAHRLGADRPDHLRVAVVAALGDVDVAPGELERRVRLHRRRSSARSSGSRNIGHDLEERGASTTATDHPDGEASAAAPPSAGASAATHRSRPAPVGRSRRIGAAGVDASGRLVHGLRVRRGPRAPGHAARCTPQQHHARRCRARRRARAPSTSG